MTWPRSFTASSEAPCTPRHITVKRTLMTSWQSSSSLRSTSFSDDEFDLALSTSQRSTISMSGTSSDEALVGVEHVVSAREIETSSELAEADFIAAPAVRSSSK